MNPFAAHLARPLVLVLAACAAALGLLPHTADAQIMRLPSRTEPAYWVTGGVGIMSQNDVSDGRTGSVWRFGQGLQWRGSAEFPISGGSTLGVTGGYARLPLTYDGPACGSCDADADVWTGHIGFHAGGGLGFHQVLQLGAGVTRFSNFRASASGETLPPEGDTDFSFSLGYGFGYGVSRTFQLFIVQDFGAVLHQRDGLEGGARTLSQTNLTRAGLRFGFGARR